MSRYYLFSGWDYDGTPYAMSAYDGGFATLPEALMAHATSANSNDWAQVVVERNGELVLVAVSHGNREWWATPSDNWLKADKLRFDDERWLVE